MDPIVSDFSAIETQIRANPNAADESAANWHKFFNNLQARNQTMAIEVSSFQSKAQFITWANAHTELTIDTSLWSGKEIEYVYATMREKAELASESPGTQRGYDFNDTLKNLRFLGLVAYPLLRSKKELMEDDDTYIKIADKKRKEWFEKHPDKGAASKEYIDYIHGSLENPDAPSITKDTEGEFRQNYREKAENYDLKARKVYQDIGQDKAVNLVEARINAHTEARVALAKKELPNMTAQQEEEKRKEIKEQVERRAYRAFVKQYQPKAEEYAKRDDQNVSALKRNLQQKIRSALVQIQQEEAAKKKAERESQELKRATQEQIAVRLDNAALEGQSRINKATLVTPAGAPMTEEFINKPSGVRQQPSFFPQSPPSPKPIPSVSHTPSTPHAPSQVGRPVPSAARASLPSFELPGITQPLNSINTILNPVNKYKWVIYLIAFIMLATFALIMLNAVGGTSNLPSSSSSLSVSISGDSKGTINHALTYTINTSYSEGSTVSIFYIIPVGAQFQNATGNYSNQNNTIYWNIVANKDNPNSTMTIKILPIQDNTLLTNRVTSTANVQSNVVQTCIGTCGNILPGMDMFKGSSVFYCQVDPSWNNACNVNYDGCGPTSVAMVTSSFGVNYNPVQMSYIFQNIDAKSCNKGDDSNSNYIGWLQSNGFDIRYVPDNSDGTLNLSQAANYIDTGYIILGSSHQAPCPPHPPAWGCADGKTTVDHIFVIDGVDTTNNKIAVLDPINCNIDHPAVFEDSGRIVNNSFVFWYALAIKKP